MSACVNNCIFVGNVGQTPELRKAGDQSVCDLRIACSDKVKGVERVEWINVVCWGMTAEAVCKFVEKGRQVYVSGRLQTRSWEKDGQKHFKTEVIAQTVQFLGAGKASPSSADDEPPF